MIIIVSHEHRMTVRSGLTITASMTILTIKSNPSIPNRQPTKAYPAKSCIHSTKPTKGQLSWGSFANNVPDVCL